jgi:hypothetical protein
MKIINSFTGLTISEMRNIFIIILLLSAGIPFTSCTEEPIRIPILDTIEATSDEITTSTALLRGELKSLGNINITEFGIEISQDMLFAQSVSGTLPLPATTGVFTVEFTDLEPSAKYYFKAYALINTARVYSSNVPTFTTKPAAK